MKKYCFTILGFVLLFAAASCSDSTCEQKVKDLEKQLSVMRSSGSDDSFDKNGTVKEKTIERYDNGAKKLVVTYLGSGSKEQTIKKVSYYSNGKVKEEENYKNNELDGPYREYYRNGQVSVSCTYSQGQRHGDYVEYYYDGKKWETGSFIEGEYDGEYITYFANGKIKSYELYMNGDRVEAVWYNLDGEVEFKN